MTKPLSVSLARRFATMAALLAGIAMLGVAGASWWLIHQEHAASLRSLLKKDAELQAATVSSNLREIAGRMSELATSSLIANALLDSAGKERYLTPFLSGIQRIHDIPVDILFADFEGREIARNGNGSFSEQELIWLKEKLPAGQPAARVQPGQNGEQGEQLIAVEFIVLSRSNSVDGALLYRIKLDDLSLQEGVRLVRGPESEQLLHSQAAIAVAVNLPQIYKHFNFAVLTSPDPTARPVDWQPLLVFFILAAGMVVTVILLGLHFGKRLTRDLGALNFFARGVSEKGFGTGRAEAADSLEVASLAQSINRMLDHLKQQHDKLHESEERFRSVFEYSKVGIGVQDADGRYWDVNPAFVEMTGYSEEELLRLSFKDITHPDDVEIGEATRKKMLAGVINHSDVEKRYIRKDGSTLWVDMTASAGRDDAGKLVSVIGISQDISERKRAEGELIKRYEKVQELNSKLQETQSQLLQAEKMASVGQLAAGVAHEINNPIGYVYSNLGTLEKYVQNVFSMIDHYERAEGAIADSEVRTRLQVARGKLDIAFLKDDLRALMEESKEGITRVKNIVRDLKDFSHVDASAEWHLTDLHKGLDSTLNIVNIEIKYKAEVVKEYGGLPEVECLASQLNQVFMNLLVNAAHAIEERGAITVRTGQEGEDVWVEIADSGKGIPPENLTKIFDPFFTTKPIGQGTGLGLSLSYGIMQKHHGRIEVQSEVGKGTTFRVWLPVRQPQVMAA